MKVLERAVEVSTAQAGQDRADHEDEADAGEPNGLPVLGGHELLAVGAQAGDGQHAGVGVERVPGNLADPREEHDPQAGHRGQRPQRVARGGGHHGSDPGAGVLLDTAAATLEAPPQLLTPADGAIRDQGGRSMTHAELVRARFGFDGGEHIGHGRVQPEGGNALFEEMHFAPDGVLLNDTLLSYRIPHLRTFQPSCGARSSRMATARPVRRQGLRRGRARGGSGRRRERAGRRGRADDHAATHPRTGLAADTRTEDQLKPEVTR
jgi:hypothetical protein